MIVIMLKIARLITFMIMTIIKAIATVLSITSTTIITTFTK